MTAAVTPAEGGALARMAARAVGATLAGRPLDVPRPAEASLLGDGASFVTLERSGLLRGCVGTLDPVRPLYRDVLHNAVRAMTDPRLPPVTSADWPDLDVKVSVLSGSRTVGAGSFDDLVAVLRPGVDGLILTDGSRRATFLPAVWQRLPDPVRFVAALLAKGGWSAGVWPAGMRASTYTSEDFRDPAPRAVLARAFPPDGH